MIFYLFLILSAGLTGGTFLLYPSLSPVLVLLLFPAFYLALTLLFVSVLWVISLFLPREEPEKHRPFPARTVYATVDFICHLCGFRVRVEGKEKIPPEPCVFIANHVSVFDPMLMMYGIRRKKWLFISKAENFRIPIAGRFLRRARFLSLERNNPLNGLRTVRKAGKLVKEGYDMGIFPEGTRNRNPENRGSLLPFKQGAGYAAVTGDCPLVIVALLGMNRVKPPYVCIPKTVTLRVLDTVRAETVREWGTEKLTAYAETLLAEEVRKSYPSSAKEPSHETVG
ncbi:MAG: 1-acyl-sn-glycerol-3-phosphate acyltransferase [Clostridia bacterium]|nr:1-acyl-sn-glycerol-3-phosphate acyltransferase [Clostridia bacterium]